MKNYDYDNEIIAHRSNKNTKKFCNGKKDKPHSLFLEPMCCSYQKNKILYYKIRCVNCGKIIKCYFSKKSLESSIHQDLIIKK